MAFWRRLKAFSFGVCSINGISMNVYWPSRGTQHNFSPTTSSCSTVTELGVTVLFSLLNQPNQERGASFKMQISEAEREYSPVNKQFQFTV